MSGVHKRIKNDVKRLADAHSSLILAKHYPHFMRALAVLAIEKFS